MLKISNYKKIFLKEVVFQFIEKTVRMVLGIIVIKQLSEYFGPSNYGIFNFVEIYFMIFIGLSVFGSDVTLVRKFKKDDSDMIIGNGLSVLTIFTLIFFLISFIVISISFDSLKKDLLFLVSLGVLFNPLYVIECYLISKNKIRVTSILKSISFVLKSVLILLFISYKFNLKSFVLIIVLESFIYNLSLYIYFLKSKKKLSFHFDLKIIKEIIYPSIYLCLYSLGTMIYFRIDIFMIEYFLTDLEMGIYTAAYKLMSFTFFIPAIISNTLFPKIIEIVNSKTPNVKSLKNMYKLNFYISLIIFISIFLLSEFLIDNLFGTKFKDSIIILKIISFNVVLISISSIYLRILYSKNLEKRLLSRILTGIFINIILNLFLIGSFGLTGVAVSTLLSLIILELFYDFFDKKLLDHHIIKLKSLL